MLSSKKHKEKERQDKVGKNSRQVFGRLNNSIFIIKFKFKIASL